MRLFTWFIFRKVDWSRVNLTKIRKDFYNEDQRVAARDPAELKNWMTEKEVSIIENGRNKVT